MVDPLEAKLGSKARILLPIAILTFVGLSAWRMWPRGPEVVSVKGPTMGTSFAVTVVGADLDDAAISKAVRDQLDEANALMSNYIDDSEITRFNRHRGADPFPLSGPMLEVLTISEEVAALSEGAFDVTIPPLLEAWGFGPRGDADRPPPSEAELAERRLLVDHKLLRLDAAASTATKGRPELEIDLSAIAPGYAADRIAAALEALGYRRYMVDVGGEFRVLGTNAEGVPWRLGIERPAATRADAPTLQEVLPMTSGALATSGDYRSYRELDGRRVSHTIDPRTGRPIEHALASVSVVHRDAAHADALATALNVLGPVDGLALAERASLAVMMIVRAGDGFEVVTTPAFDALRAPEARAKLGGT
ncbi:MAG: FAD:protein FMN transferase [Myxococcales bacterium]|nr:FAD:protein FMN transferase [Myxococcales bacterium]